ncbi:hypothetical protein OROHE_022048 [Orobanche hederae]
MITEAEGGKVLKQLLPGYLRRNALSSFDSILQLGPDVKKPDIFVRYIDNDSHEYFCAHSVEEDGTISSSPKYYIYPPSHLTKNCFFTGACRNGLLHFQNMQWDHLLWNPTTNEFKTLPEFDKHPRVTNHHFGSGIWCDNRCADNYKLLQLVMADKVDEEGRCIDLRYYYHLYSLKTNSWKKIPTTQFGNIGMCGACINDCFYCGATQNDDTDVILSFDFSTETLSSLPLPPGSGGLCSYYFLEYKGLFGFFICWEAERIPFKFELWVRKNESWTRESVFHARGVYRPLWFARNGELLYFASLIDEILAFDRTTGKLKHLGIHPFTGSIFPFFESFVQFNGVSDVEEQEEEEEEEEEEKNDMLLKQKRDH